VLLPHRVLNVRTVGLYIYILKLYLWCYDIAESEPYHKVCCILGARIRTRTYFDFLASMKRKRGTLDTRASCKYRMSEENRGPDRTVRDRSH
jgi:hypothetical protein